MTQAWLLVVASLLLCFLGGTLMLITIRLSRIVKALLENFSAM